MGWTSFRVPLAYASLPPFRYPCFRSKNVDRLPSPSAGHWILDMPQSGMGQLRDRHAHSLADRWRIRPNLYTLSRRVNVATATTISLITFLGTMVSLLAVGLYSILVSGTSLGSLFSVAIWPLTIIVGLMTTALLWPGLFRAAVSHALKAYRRISNLRDSHQDRMELAAARLVALVYDYHYGTWKFIRTGKTQFAGVCLLSFVFILARCLMAFLCLRFLGIGNSTLGEVLQIQMALLFLLYFAPTPGSSGLAEVFSLSAMAAIVPAGLAPYYNLLWRASTVYLTAVLGCCFSASRS